MYRKGLYKIKVENKTGFRRADPLPTSLKSSNKQIEISPQKCDLVATSNINNELAISSPIAFHS
jgi:hypothetical protein